MRDGRCRNKRHKRELRELRSDEDEYSWLAEQEELRMLVGHHTAEGYGAIHLAARQGMAGLTRTLLALWLRLRAVFIWPIGTFFGS